MPPRKRARVSPAPSATDQPHPKSPTPAESQSDEQLLNDPWTDEEEAGLFKGLIRWKPTGVHKHFNLLALHQYLLTNGYIDSRNAHTRPNGIWQKLRTLYDLEALDSREDARQLSDLSDEDQSNSGAEDEDEDEYYSEAANKIHNTDFFLPEDDDFAERKWQQRFASGKQKRDESPPLLPELNLAEAPPVRFTPSFSVEPDELGSKAMKEALKRHRAEVKEQRKGGRSTRTSTTTNTRRSARQAGSVAEDEHSGDGGKDEDEEDGEVDDGDPDDEGENNEEDGDEEENEDDDDDEGEDEDENGQEDDGNTDQDEDQAGAVVARSKRAGRKAKRPEPVKRASTRRKRRGR